MTKAKTFRTALLVVLLLALHGASAVNARKVHVRVVNRLGDGQRVDLHCRSKEDDLGHVELGEEREATWQFSVNFFGTTLFHCGVRWPGSGGWRAFDAYDARRDHARCRSECRWMISKEGMLYGYDEEIGKWVLFPFEKM